MTQPEKSGGSVAANDKGGSKTNILLITADQWRGDCLSAVGHPLVRTPHLDKLAAKSVLFRNHFTNAVPCSPARACLYTGLYQMNNRVCMNGSPLDRRHDTLALAFRRLGYEPTLFGYTDQTEDHRELHPNDPRLQTYEGLLPGFNWRVCMSDDQRNWLSWLESQGYNGALQQDPVAFHIPASGVDDPPTGAAPVYRAEHTETAYIVGEFARWLGEENTASRKQSNSPGWFAHLSFLRPHPPFTVPEPFNTMYRASDVPPLKGNGGWQSVAAQHPLLEYLVETNFKDRFIPGTDGRVREWSERDLKAIAAIYYGMVSEVDDQIGRVLSLLEHHGETDSTIVVFTSDHGEQLGDHCLLGKYGFYDESFHVPLIIHDPRTLQKPSAGKVVEALTEAVDLMPTLLSLVDAPIPVQLDGCSLEPWLGDTAPASWRTHIHWEYDFRDVVTQNAEQHFGIASQACNLSVSRSVDYKYVHCAQMPPLLFDLKQDPHECENVVDDANYQSIRQVCAEELLSWRAQHLDQSMAMSRVTADGVFYSDVEN